MRLPCGNCVGCRSDRAKQWALRCSLELQQHPTGAVATLTYASAPPTLRKADLSGFLKRLRMSVARSDHQNARPVRRLRFFASGEYGDRFARPHYHVLLFGLDSKLDAPLIVQAWSEARRVAFGKYEFAPIGHVHLDKITPRSIAYVAGYCSKKIGWRADKGREVVDPETGEVLPYEPPFILCSRGGRSGGGLASVARDSFPQSWRTGAFFGGARVPVPRYLHEGWKSTASPEELAELEAEKAAKFEVRSREELRAGEAAAEARHSIAARRRADA